MMDSSPSQAMGEVHLPIADAAADDPEYHGWTEERVAESDLWDPARALERSPHRRERWLTELRDETTRRQAWWDRSNQWVNSITGSEGGGNHILDLNYPQELVWDAMVVEELCNRIEWNLYMRSDDFDTAFGTPLATWKLCWRRHYRRRFMGHPRSLWAYVWHGSTATPDSEESQPEESEPEFVE